MLHAAVEISGVDESLAEAQQDERVGVPVGACRGAPARRVPCRRATACTPRPGSAASATDGAKIDADASKIRSVRYVRATALRAKPAADIAALTAQAEAADSLDHDPQALPTDLARRAALNAELDAACARLEAEARAQAEAARPAYEAKKAAYDARTGRRGRPPKPPDELPPPDRQSNLTDPDGALTVEPVFGIIRSAMGFARLRLRGIQNVAAGWTSIALACNRRRLNRMMAA